MLARKRFQPSHWQGARVLAKAAAKPLRRATPLSVVAKQVQNYFHRNACESPYVAAIGVDDQRQASDLRSTACDSYVASQHQNSGELVAIAVLCGFVVEVTACKSCAASAAKESQSACKCATTRLTKAKSGASKRLVWLILVPCREARNFDDQARSMAQTSVHEGGTADCTLSNARPIVAKRH